MAPAGARLEFCSTHLQPPPNMSAAPAPPASDSAPHDTQKIKTKKKKTLGDPAAPIDAPAPDSKKMKIKKSKKRRAAEALLERKASKQKLDGGCDSPVRPRFITLNACDCSTSFPPSSLPAPTAINLSTWCALPVTIPPIDWPSILTEVAANKPCAAAPQSPTQPLPGGIEVVVVDTLGALRPALSMLRSSMQDGIVGIDLEWRPDRRPGSNNRVGLIQLASATACILIRPLRLGTGKKLPQELTAFFADPSLTFVSFSWDSADEGKMTSSFGCGRTAFARFLDLQEVATQLGYHSIGLAALTLRVLGVSMPKSRAVSRSDWQALQLSRAQVQYAALDALLTGYVFRGLRLWHDCPSPCTACKRLLGTEVLNAITAAPLKCQKCDKSCRSVAGLLNHLQSTGHPGSHCVCGECGRLDAARS